ncbi:DUF3667 domain-containing protein [Sphingobium sp. H39-3-25]|uniref:DUF3667 domain-containing protein n=1 Tax=Sphingobium arseniciresistens TaxID=3030834 RepID=UPI0023B91357|nr:DUF3667 domain-containing protein [Sphingobium arseniciresistens]
MSSGGFEAAGDALTGGIVAHAVEGESHAGHGAGKGSGHDGAHGTTCLNCGAALGGPYCAQCGQSSHIHRTLHSIGHDILHGVFHFEGRIWRTLPELLIHPGRLTRRFIDGERAKFISPLALFLFTVFMMFAVFGYTGGALFGGATINQNGKRVAIRDGNWRSAIQREAAVAKDKLDTLEARRARPGLKAEKRAKLDQDIAAATAEYQALSAAGAGDWAKLAALDKNKGAAVTGSTDHGDTFSVNTGNSYFDSTLKHAIEKAKEDPDLLLYKLKVNGYKYSWMLIPLSMPFLWILFCWRRDVHLYDHAIFATYSISFMMVLLILLSILAVAFGPSAIWVLALLIIPPVHMYKQLRSAYGPSSRFMTLMRLSFLLASSVVVLAVFMLILFALGALH